MNPQIIFPLNFCENFSLFVYQFVLTVVGHFLATVFRLPKICLTYFLGQELKEIVRQQSSGVGKFIFKLVTHKLLIQLIYLLLAIFLFLRCF